MALTVYVGGSESDSFVSLSDAYDLLSEMFTDISEWDDMSVAQKELRLRLSAQLMGSLPLRGGRVFRNQRLCFPRTSQPYNQRFKIPDCVKRGQVYLAFGLIHRALAESPSADSGLPESFGNPTQISLAGLVSVSFGDRSAKGGTVFDRIVEMLPFPVYMEMKNYIAQIRGGAVLDSDEVPTLSTTTVTVPVTTTTVPVTTTTV